MKKALVVVDYQVDFVSGSLGFEGAETLDAKITDRIKRALRDGEALIFTLDTHAENYLDTREGKNLPVVHCVDGSDGWALYGETAQYLSFADAVFKKNTFGSFELGEYLRERKFDEVELCGLVSSICVISNAVIAQAALPDATIVVDSSLTSGGDKALDKAALEVMAGFQVKVI